MRFSLLSAAVSEKKMCMSSSSLVVHVSAHLLNVVNFSVSYSDDFPDLNLARYRGEVGLTIVLNALSPLNITSTPKLL